MSISPPAAADKIQQSTSYEVRFSAPFSPNLYAGEVLYRGQTGVEKSTLFQNLEAFVWEQGSDVNDYWTLDDLPQEEDDGYGKITGGSFDPFGMEVVTDFPVSIPEDQYSMTIFISCRLSLDDPWTEYTSFGLFGDEPGVTYTLLDGRMVVLDSILESEGQVISKDHILNIYNQYLDAWTDAINLLQYQKQLLGDRGTRLTTLFPGWKEDGELVPLSYGVASGRHVLEPAGRVTLSEDYQVEITGMWMSPDYSVPANNQVVSNATYGYAQLLTDYRGADKIDNWVERLTVPQYVQAVQFNDYPGLTVDTLELPESVLYVDTFGIPNIDEDWLLYDRGLKVTQAYAVAQGNPRYSSEDGRILNAEGTGLSVIPASQYDPRQDGSQSGYVLRDDCLLTSDQRLHQALRESAHWLALPDGITGVEAGALSGLSDGLEVLILPQGTRAVGYQTFRNCWNLVGVLIERRGAFLFSKNAFEGSASLRFVASNAPTMILEDPDLALFNNDISLEYSFLYCLGDNSGYNSNWTSLMDADHYELLNCGGTRVLYAVTENGTPFAALRSGGKVSGDVALPVTTTVVFRGAFMGAKSTGGVDLGNEVFYSCRSLTAVRLGEMRAEGGIFHSAFSGSGLQELILEDTEPPKLIYYAQGYDFYFEYDQEAAGALHITVPAGSELVYVRAWRCNRAGYVAEHGRTAFQSMGEGPADQLFFDFFREPTVEEIREAVDTRLLAAENRTRALLGLDPVEALEWNYTYIVGEEGFITLTGVGDIGSETDLTAATVDLPYAWCLDYIAADAFQNAPQLRSVFLPEGLAAIRANAFRGVTFDEGDETDGLILYLNSVEDIFDLTPEGLGVPFTFGVADDRIRVLSWDAAMEDEEAIAAFVQQWTLPMAEYADLDELEAAVRAQLGEDATLAQVRAAMADILLPAENRVRTLLEYVDETDRLTFSFTLEGEGSTLPDTDPNLPDLPPAPPQGTDGSGDEDGDGTGGTSGSDGGDGSNGNDTGNTETEGETAQ